MPNHVALQEGTTGTEMEMEIGMKDDDDANDVVMLNRNILVGRYAGT